MKESLNKAWITSNDLGLFASCTSFYINPLKEDHMSNIIPFSYQEKEIRIIEDQDGNPWWVAKDVCGVLDIVDTNKSVQNLDDDEKGTTKVLTPGGEQSMIIINEPGLYTLILRSNKPEAKPFRKWVTTEVLPSIRKTGSYAMPDHEPETLIPVSKEFKAAVAIAKAAGLKGNQATLCANKAVRRITGVNLLDIIGATHLICEKQEQHLTATQLGKILGLTAQKTNKLLESKGVIESYRDGKNKLKWKPTAEGKQYTVLKDTGKKSGSGTPVQQLFFLDSVREVMS